MSPRIEILDLEFQGHAGLIASFLIFGPHGHVLVESGPGSTLPAMRAGLARHGLEPGDGILVAASAGAATTSLELSSPAQQLLPSMHHLLLNCHHKPFQQRLSRLPEVDERSPKAAMAAAAQGSKDELN